MVMKYTCPTCCNTSKDWAEINTCRKRGKKNKHKVGETVTFRRTHTNETGTGVISEVAFKRQTHEVIYVLLCASGFTNIGEEDIVEHKLAASA